MKPARIDWDPAIRPEPIENLRIRNLDGSRIAFFGHVIRSLPNRVREFFCLHQPVRPTLHSEAHELGQRVTAKAHCTKCGMQAYACLANPAPEDRPLLAQAVSDYFNRLSRGWWRCL